jgi:formate dehydrogenase maturation protein FdhE
VPHPPERPARAPRSAPREVTELRALAERHPELREAVDMHVEILEMYRRVQGRVPLPWLELSTESLTRHNAEGHPVLRFEEIPIELTDLRLLVRQTADLLKRHDAIEETDYVRMQELGRDGGLSEAVRRWYEETVNRHAAGTGEAEMPPGDGLPTATALDQVLTIAMKPFLSRCAEVMQQRSALAEWSHPHCALCGSEPDLAVITPAAERHLICSRCTLQWKFEPLTCPYCLNRDRSRITSFATTDGQYRVYACDVCRRYLKAYDGRGRNRPLMPVVDAVATLPLDAAAIQRGYS